MPSNDTEFHAFSSTDMKKFMEQMKWQPFDMGLFMDLSRKNVQTLANIQQLGLEAWQDMIQKTQSIAQELANEQAQMATSVLNEGAPEEKIAKAAERMRKTYERAHGRYREIADMQHKLGQDMSDLLSRRIKANLSDLKDVAEK